MTKRDDPQVKVRLPADLYDWMKEQIDHNRSTASGEVARALRERKDRLEKAA